MKPLGLAGKNLKSRGPFKVAVAKTFAVCIRNTGYEVYLKWRKIYEVLRDAQAQQHKQLRVRDESGEDYLYHLFIEREFQGSRFARALWELA
jgi:hypothetical protein